MVKLDGRNTGAAILETAQSLGCDLLIKGAYTQSRLRQMIFGAATSTCWQMLPCPTCSRTDPVPNVKTCAGQ